MIYKNSPVYNSKSLKKLFYGSTNLIFENNIAIQSSYRGKDIIWTLQSAMRDDEYIETFVRNNKFSRVPSGDTIYRRLSESIDFEKIEPIIDNSVKIGMSMGVFSEKVNVAIDEHDEPYYGKDNKYLINVGKKKFRGTDKAIRIASLDVVMEEKRFTVAFMPKHPIDGIDNSKEVEILLNKVINQGIKINLVLVDRGYLDVGVLRNIENLGLKYIVPAKENPKTKNFMNYPLQYSSMDHCS